MGTITARKRKDGSIGYMARVRVVRDGESYHETETFDRRPAAAAWISKRERELSKPGAVAKSRNDDPTTLAKVIDRYVEESVKGVGRTKAQVLKAIKEYDIANMPCSSIKSKDIVEFLQSLTAKPQTVGNYASHLGAIFAIARPMWGYRLDEQEMKDAVKVARRMGIISKSAQRDRRPTLDELDRLIGHFIERRKKAPQGNANAHSPRFRAIFDPSPRGNCADQMERLPEGARARPCARYEAPRRKDRQSHLDRPARSGDPDHRQHAEEQGRDIPLLHRCHLREFYARLQALGHQDLRFHDLRHEGISRRFEMGRNIPRVAAVSGHRSWISLKRYTHIRETGDKYAGWHSLQLVIDTK